MRMNNELLARAVPAAREGQELTDVEHEAITSELDDAFAEYGDGLELDPYE